MTSEDASPISPDEQEARSLKYSHCAQILHLSSGNYALFGAFSNITGIDLLFLGPWTELEQHVIDYALLAEKAYAEPKVAAKVPNLDQYANLFGDE